MFSAKTACPRGLLLAVFLLLVTACGDPGPTFYFETLPPGSALPDDATCTEQVRADPSEENRPENTTPNNTVVDVDVVIDGALEMNDALAPRITGEFTGTTEQVLRWVSCKWGFDEDITRARAVTESSWLMSTAGDVTEDAELCGLLDLEAPCSQSYGLLQVKGTVHEGTFPFTNESSTFGAEYAMAWLRACYEGAFTWLSEDGYEAGDEWGCVGAWFSGEWYDEGALTYIAEVERNLETRAWEVYQP